MRIRRTGLDRLVQRPAVPRTDWRHTTGRIRTDVLSAATVPPRRGGTQLKLSPENPGRFTNAKEWHVGAKKLLLSWLAIEDGHSISQKLKWNAGLESALAVVGDTSVMPQTIHAVKGSEYPAVCVVTTRSLKGILDFLEKGEREDKSEEARKLYVAASRAEKLLVFAAPNSQAGRLRSFLSEKGADVTIAGGHYPALREQIFHVAKAQAEPIVMPDGVTGDCGRESVSAIGGSMGFHGKSLPAKPQLDNTDQHPHRRYF